MVLLTLARKRIARQSIRTSTEHIDQANCSFTQEARGQIEGEMNPSSRVRIGWFREWNPVPAVGRLQR